MRDLKKELHYQSEHLRNLVCVSFLVTPIEFPTELCNVEISPITLLKRNPSREALLATLKNSQEVFPVGSVFSIVIDSKLDSSN